MTAIFAAALTAGTPGRAAFFGSGSATPTYESARALFDGGDHRGAITELKRYLKAEPANGAARLLIGRALIRSGDGQAAEEQLRRAAELDADPNELAVALARSYVLQRKFEELLAEIERSDRPPDIEATLAYLRGLAHYGLRQFAEADRALAATLTFDSNHSGASLARARIRIARIELDDARKLVADVTKRAPNIPDAWYLSGEIARLRGDTRGALAAYGKALAIAPTHTPARLARAAISIHTDRLGDAAADIEIALSLSPSDPQASLLKAVVLSRRGQPSEATAAIDRLGSTLDRQHKSQREQTPSHVLLTGIVNFGRGVLDDSFHALNKYLASAPDHLDSKVLISTIQGERGDYGAAISILQRVPSFGTAAADLFGRLGNLNVRIGRLDEAKSALETALVHAPASRSLARRLALIQVATGGRSIAADTSLEDLIGAIGTARGGVLFGLLRLGDNAGNEADIAARAVAALEPQSALAHNLAGIVRARKGDWEKAREHFRQARALEPGYLPAFYNLAASESANGEPASARQHYRDLLTLAPRERAAMLELSAFAERAGDWNTAIEWMVRALDLQTNDVPALVALNDLYLRAGRFPDARTLAPPPNRIGRQDKRLLEAGARAFIAIGDIDTAAKLYRNVSSAETGTADELNRIARIQIRLGDIRGAIFTFKSALALEAANQDARNGALELEAPSGGSERELIYAESLRNRYPGSGIGHVVAGNAWSRANRPDKAADAYAEALRLEPSSETALRRFHALRRAKKAERARRFLERWTNERSDDEAARRALAFASIRAGRLSRAKELFTAILAGAPRDGVVLNNLAWLSAQLGHQDALPYARRALTLRPNDPAVLDTHAMILADGGEPQQGLELLRRALGNGTADARIHFHAALILHRLGQRAAARTELEAALRFDRDFQGADEARRLLRTLGGA